MNPKWYFQVEERGSTGSKGIKKSAGVIDSGYRGEIFIALTNTNEKDIVISKFSKETTAILWEDRNTFKTSALPGDHRNQGIIYYPYEKAIAQLVLHEVPEMKIKEVSYEELLEIPSGRGTGNLGISGN